jgi:transposase
MNTKGTISQRPPSPVYNILPTKVTRSEFNRYIKPHLSRSKTKQPKISYFKIFNHILYVLHTGIQWYQLPVIGVHWTNIYRHFNRWSKDGSCERIFNGSLLWLQSRNKLDTSILHGDGSNVIAKKGALELAIADTNTREVKKLLILKIIAAMY